MEKLPELLKIVFEMSPGFISLVDATGKILIINKAGANQLGYEPEEVIGKNLTSNQTQNYDTAMQFWNDTENGKQETRIVKLTHKNGQKRTWEFVSKLITFENEPLIITMGNDFTDKFETQKELEIADKLYDLNLNRLHKTLLDLQKAKTLADETSKIKQQFLANVSHEIRTPMNAIIGFSNILLKSILKSQELQYVNAIKKSGDNLMNIINEILDLSKLESGNFGFDETDFDLIEIVDSVKMLFELRIEDKGLDYFIEYAPNLNSKLIGDPGRLYQILVNIVGNSIKFTDKGFIKIGVEEIEKTKEGVLLRFSISDTGIGIEEKNLTKVFDSFTQATNDTTRKYGGTGLGLTICKQMVELQGGKIYLTSIFGQGCTFIFELPYKVSSENIIVETHAPDFYFNQHDSLGKYKILLVEDNEINILLASKVLEDWGFQFSIAINGKKAISRLEMEHFDLILMDVQMPEMDGYEATTKIRESNAKYKNIPIIATTAHAAKNEAEKALKAGMNDYVSKPFQLEVLLQKMLKLLNNESQIDSSKKENGKKLEQLTNLDYLKRVAAGDTNFVRKMIQLFLTQSPETIAKIRVEMNNNNWEAFRSNIHKIMPSISFMGITALNKELHQIDETKLEPKNLQAYTWVIDQLELIIKQSSSELEEYLASLQV